ncbi:MAG: SGNH/GDSL hydrolase family protein, partial [Pirellula sp.]
MQLFRFRTPALLELLVAWLAIYLIVGAVHSAPPLQLRKGDHIAYIGNATADRMQHSAWLETYIHAMFPEYDLTVRNLGYPGDELKTRNREDNFGSPDEWLTKVKANVVFCFFGYNEALRGSAALDGFKKDLAETIDGMLSQKYDGQSSPRLVFFSPIAHEDLKDPNLPNGEENNKKLAIYTQAMREVCEAKNVLFVDLFAPSKELYSKSTKPLTLNGIHLEDNGDQAISQVIAKALFPNEKPSQLRATPKHVVTIDHSVATEPMVVFVEYCFTQFGDTRVIES